MEAEVGMLPQAKEVKKRTNYRRQEEDSLLG